MPNNFLMSIFIGGFRSDTLILNPFSERMENSLLQDTNPLGQPRLYILKPLRVSAHQRLDKVVETSFYTHTHTHSFCLLNLLLVILYENNIN